MGLFNKFGANTPKNILKGLKMLYKNSKVYVLRYSTGEYEDYREYNYGYFNSEEEALDALEKLKEFDKRVRERSSNWRFLPRAYRLVFGISIYRIEDDGIHWKIETLNNLGHYLK